jgi:hypothetical protein
MKTNWNLARRDLLKSLGVGAACLPLLQATKSWGQAAVTKKRFVVLQMSEGLRQQYWKPNAGPLGMLTPTLVPFEPIKADLTVIPGLTNGGGGGGHGSYGCVYFGMGGTGGGQYKEPTGKTVDQTVALGLGKPASGHLTLNLGVQMARPPVSTSSPGGTKCFWTGAGQPINPVLDPYAVYKDIFAGGDVNPNADPAAVKRLIQQKKSILDYIGSTLDDFKSRLGTEDRVSIDAHHESVRQLESQLASAPVDASKCGGSPMAGIDLNAYETYPIIMKAHLNLMVAALKCGVTNVATLQTGDSSGNNINFGAFVEGLPAKSSNNYKSPYRNWHDLGHNPIQGGVDHKKIVDSWFMDQWMKNFFSLMKAAPEAGGTLYDNTLTLIGNHMEEGANHNSNAIPWMLVGKGWGYLNAGNCIPGGGAKVSAVMAGICGAMGVDHPYGAPLNGLKKG